MQIHNRFTLTWLLAASLTTALHAQTTTSPADRGGLEGSTSTSYPLGRHDCRFQQLYSDLGKARVLSGHAYRRDALSTRGTIAAFKTNLTVALSQAKLSPAKASTTFADNAGPATTVLSSSEVSLPQTSRPTQVPAAFEFSIPYKSTYLWAGTGTLCVDVTIHGNSIGSAKNQTFSASLDAHLQYTSGRNLQPGYPFGTGCPAPGQTRAATTGFEIRHLGKRLDLGIDARYGVATTSSSKAQSALLLSNQSRGTPWPFGSKCTVYGEVSHVVLLPGDNSTTGARKVTIPVGTPPAASFTMFGQILSYNAAGAVALSQGARLITPPVGVGVTTSRIVAASDRNASTCSVSFAAPVTRFR